jgi:type III secretion protein R
MDSLPVFLGGILALLLLTSFAKIFTALSVLRVGMGLEGLGMGAIVGGFALLLSAVVMQPQLQPMGGLEGLLRGELRVSSDTLEKQFRPFMERNADPSVMGKLAALTAAPASASGESENSHKDSVAGGEAKSPTPSLSFSALALSFMITELKKALELGVLFIVPFVVIDLLVVNLLMALHITQISARVASLPLKLLLFFSVDGWTLIAEKLLSGYR